MDLDTVTDELYALPRDEFIAVRDERARQARADGDRELATEIGRLRKPSTAAWLANLLAREQPGEINGLVELGEALRRAHSELDGDALRRLSGQRHELVAELAGQARQLGRSAGRQVSESVSRELEDTFTAALGNPDAARVLAAGRLSSGLQPGASDEWGWPSGGGSQQHGSDPGVQQRGSEPRTRQRDQKQRDQLRRDLDAARRAASDAEASLRDAADSLSRAERNEDAANQTVTERRAELAAAEHAAGEAADERAAARRNHEAADRQARQSQQRVDDLERSRDD
ncbi:MAG: hypothetical protein GEU83_07200 [Pseudonocardiaceae bacterium]|nr:hypothetical protein [Pseudonocardiaceae bacterium]